MRWEAFIFSHGKFNQKNMYNILSESASFCERYDKTFWCVFRFTNSTAVHLQNTNDKFHKVVQRHYLGEVENVYISVRQIYSRQYIPYIHTSKSVEYCRRDNKTFRCVFFGSQCKRNFIVRSLFQYV